jgi:hypothetical protein
MRNHDQMHSLTKYNGCHEFVGESTIHFDNKIDLKAIEAQPTAALTPVPAKVRLKLRLTSPIDSDTAWTGDAITATLENALKDRRGHLIAPKGSVVSGRIAGLRAFLGEKPWWSIDLRFDRIHTPSGDKRMSLETKSPITVADPNRMFRHGSPFPDSEDLIKPGPSEFHISGSNFQLDTSFVTEWEARREAAPK